MFIKSQAFRHPDLLFDVGRSGKTPKLPLEGEEEERNALSVNGLASSSSRIHLLLQMP